jgi:hypothetical protein
LPPERKKKSLSQNENRFVGKDVPFNAEVTALFDQLLDEYLNGPIEQTSPPEKKSIADITAVDQAEEEKAIKAFLSSPCRCGQDCQA